MLVWVCLAWLTTAWAGSLVYPVCEIDRNLATLASSRLTLRQILDGIALPRTCPRSSRASTTTLAYVTPWNKAGYAYTELHADRIAFVAPVWYQVEVSGPQKLALIGSHEADKNTAWLQQLNKSLTSVVPRFEIRFSSQEVLEAALFFPQGEVDGIASSIVGEVRKRGYGGAVVEVPAVGKFRELVRKLGTALHADGKKLIVVVAPQHDAKFPPPVDRHTLADWGNEVDYVSLMTYDHSQTVGKEVGNAPIGWLKRVLDDLTSADEVDEDDEDDDEFAEENAPRKFPSDRILLGLNFYGFSLTADGVLNTLTAQEYTSLVEFATISMPLEVQWRAEEDVLEHRLASKLWSIWYPTVLSILHRKHLAAQYGVGLAVWEAGQGLAYFWDAVLDGPVASK
ncbi:Chitinase domain-containing protein 1 [Savitreella phatthalungensis]